jgi:phosphoribosylformylglycinamidine (FGAM) synthase PurS component
VSFTLTLEITLDADTLEKAREQIRDIAEDVLNWPAVISVGGEVPEARK